MASTGRRLRCLGFLALSFVLLRLEPLDGFYDRIPIDWITFGHNQLATFSYDLPALVLLRDLGSLIMNDHPLGLAVVFLILVFAKPVKAPEALPQAVKAGRLSDHRVKVEISTCFDALRTNDDELAFRTRAAPHPGGNPGFVGCEHVIAIKRSHSSRQEDHVRSFGHHLLQFAN